MKLLKLIILGSLLFSSPVILSACEQESALEEGAEEIADEVDDATSN